MATALQPSSLKKRSFLYRILQNAGANFAEVAGGAAASDFGNPSSELEAAKTMGLADLSPLPRTGFKGRGTIEWLQSEGLTLPEESNRAVLQNDGMVAARLSPSEMLLLGDMSGDGQGVSRLTTAWENTRSAEQDGARTARGYLVPRQETHAWLFVSGSCAATMFAKVCGVDLRPDRFPPGQIAQTSVARANGVILRQDLGETLGYHLLIDSASADFFWPAIIDAMDEFEGAPVGLASLRSLAGL